MSRLKKVVGGAGLAETPSEAGWQLTLDEQVRVKKSLWSKMKSYQLYRPSKSSSLLSGEKSTYGEQRESRAEYKERWWERGFVFKG